VPKQIEPLPEIDDSLLAERRNMAFRGTAVTGGHGAGVMVATGMATELGRLAELLQRHPAEPTPLQRRPSSLWSSRSGASAGGPKSLFPTFGRFLSLALVMAMIGGHDHH
jgi:Ca2+-transporting ATPase